VETDLACANDCQGDGAGPIQDDVGGGANVGDTTGNQVYPSKVVYFRQLWLIFCGIWLSKIISQK
jgi:hypothetical protein